VDPASEAEMLVAVVALETAQRLEAGAVPAPRTATDLIRGSIGLSQAPRCKRQRAPGGEADPALRLLLATSMTYT
jgi:hypothetical protein